MGYSKIKLRLILKLLINMIFMNPEAILIVALLSNLLISGGFMNIIIIGLILFTIVIEENLGRSFWWKIIYVIFLGIIGLKLTAH